MTRDEKLADAGEYVIGALDGAERLAFEARIATDAELAAMVSRLRDQMQALDDTAIGEELNPRVWSAIEARLGQQDSARVTHPASRAPRPWMAVAASVVIAAGLGFTAGTLSQPEAQPVVIAVLVDEGSTVPGAIVEAFSDNSVRIVPLEAFEVPDGRILQVWTLPSAEMGPVSLGTFDNPRNIRLPAISLPTPQPGQLYEITLEPAPGSPTGRPTGPILAKGLARTPVS
jgi:anti-sigma-K factor RskA